MNNTGAGKGGNTRINEASDWFARMRGPDAESLRDDFAAWLADPDNARSYAEIEQIWSAVGAASEPARFQVRRDTMSKRASWTRPALIAALVVAAAALALLLSAYGRSAAPDQPIMAYSSAVGQIRNVRLADGSRVTLDTASRVVPDFSPKERRIRLEAGRARFTVAHNPQWPFVVVAGGREIIARGTVFDVRVDGTELEVSLLEGKIDIGGVRRGERKAVRLTPGERAIMQGSAAPQIDVTAQAGASWPQGMISAESMPLAQLLAEANRYSEAKIALADPRIGGLKVTGAFRHGDATVLAAKLAAALDLASIPGPGGSVVLTRKPD